MGITARIVLPFTLLFGTVIAASSWWAVRDATRGVEERLERMTMDLAGISAEGGFLLTPPFLARIKAAYRADAAATRGDPPRLEASTFPEGTSADLQAALRGVAAEPGLRERVRVGARTYVMTWSPVRARDGAAPQVLLLFFPGEEISREKRGAALPPVVVGLIGTVLVTALGYWIARSITEPIRILAEKTREIAAGSLDRPIQVHSSDELAKLARAFEGMAGELREREQELVRAEQLATLGKVTTRIAHEIRNPLAAIRLTVQMLLKNTTDPQAREDLERILAENERLHLTVDELLGTASPVELQRSPSDLRSTVEDTLGLLARQIAHRSATLATEFADLPPVPLDRNRFKQVLLNLTLNALDAMPGGGTLTIRTTRDGDAARVEVIDSGPGIPADLAERAFEPFVTSRPGGTGLGLPLSRAIVEKHGGTLRYLRRDGLTVFEIRLPLEATTDGNPGRASDSPPPPRDGAAGPVGS